MCKKNALFKKLFLLTIMCILLVHIDVDAADTVMNKQICLSNRNLYNISWDSEKNTGITESVVNQLTQDQVDAGHIPYPLGTIETDLEKYKFNAVLLAKNCFVQNGKINTCPTNDELSKYNINRLLEIDEEKGTYVNLIIEFDENSKKFTIKIPDLYSGKVKLRYVSNGQQQNLGGTKDATSYSNFLKKENGYYVIRNVDASSYSINANGELITNTSNVVVEFYINDTKSQCNNTYISSINLVMNTIDETIEIDNPALSDASYGCPSVKEYIDNLVKIGYVEKGSSIEEVLRYNFASLCYKKKITYSDYQTLKEKIAQQFGNIKQIFNPNDDDNALTDVTTKNDVFCEQQKNTGSRSVLAAGGNWWSLNCEESYSVTGSKAKLVYAGGGFTYESEFKATRTCRLTQLRQAQLKPKCHYWCETSCVWTESTGEKTGNKGGPVEDFDECILQCDGGKYSQQCINSCYNQVYDSDNARELPVFDNKSKNISFLEDNYQIQKVGVVGTVTSSAGGVFTGWSTDGAGNPKAMYRVDVPTSHCGSVGVTFSSYCDTHNGSCTIYENHGPGGCIDNPEADYAQQLNESASEFNNLLSIMQNNNISVGTYTIKIADSYLNNNNRAFTYEISSKENPNVVSSVNGGGCTNQQTWVFGSRGESASACSQNTLTKTVKIKLPVSYLNRTTGTATYEVGINKYAKFDASGTSTRLVPATLTFSNVYYGGHKYYTNILSNNVNVVKQNDKITLVNYEDYKNTTNKKANISIGVTGFGTNSKFSSQVDCFYGVYNDTVEKCVYPCKGDDDSDDGGGITIIFRPIDLNDNFPNDRNPRWNWTDKASVLNSNTTLYSLLNYKVSPSELNKQIEKKGYNVYSDPAEIDYDITLTPENLRNIKRYNKNVNDLNSDGSKNYLDYDMTCGTIKNREYCYSNFLDNANYITYNTGFNATGRKDIAVCNNTYNGQCTN